ncbi:diaminopimelate epimerase [Levilactobacillus koreensis JCM 16448]|uniref:Diaminopimelate epimerase n=1 Tax=Levilactobacillus koreensis TaxID=637971 RepID=A0AAC8ZFW9_9LACO|nr:diaminopimelate epimerase [Levilactobacillus koreensis]AKP63598.1 diaminopimelate epimerase [Levilactobacillus koreensis]KRK92018.1 diaminopimelate epimerase [Levilactobacillus koreensis JCM 16448]
MLTLIKAHGSENQFFLLDQRQLTQPLTDIELSRIARQLCHPHTGLLGGADGLLVIAPSPNTTCLGAMRVINADGSEAKMCGNGLRTVSRYLAEQSGKTHFQVATLEADLDVARSANLAPDVPAFSVQIGPISMAAATLPFAYHQLPELFNTAVPEFVGQQTFTAIAVPNPHLISFVDHLDPSVLGELGRRLNAPNPYFPEGVNVSFAKLLGPNRLFVQTYERGVGFTNACGTGMSATSLAFAMQHPTQFDASSDLVVLNPGGLVRTHVTLGKTPATSTLRLIGNATFTAKVSLSEPDLHAGNFSAAHVETTNEEAAYQAFVHHAKQSIL